MRVAQLDVSTKAGLWKMRAYILLSFVTVLWSRVFRYAYLILALMSDFIEAEDWGFVCGGAVAALLMSAFNVLVLVFVPGLDNRWVRRHTHKSIIVVVFIKLTIFIFCQ